MTDRIDIVNNLYEEASNDEEKLSELVDALASDSRRTRQNAASAIYLLAKDDASRLTGYIDEFIDALNRPEAQTRWEILETMTLLVEYDARGCSKAIQEAEANLFDEDSGPVRLGAMKLLCKIGATTANRSEKVWPLIDEGIQCYHGDLEFNDMLNAIIEFSSGKLSDSVKEKLAARMSFDSTNGKGTLKKRATQIIENLQ